MSGIQWAKKQYRYKPLIILAEFIQGVELEDITGNEFSIEELLNLGIRYLAFFGGGRDYIVNAMSCDQLRGIQHPVKWTLKLLIMDNLIDE